MTRRGGLALLLLIAGCNSSTGGGDAGLPPAARTGTSPVDDAVELVDSAQPPVAIDPAELRAEGSWDEGTWAMTARRDEDGVWCIEFTGAGSPGLELCDAYGSWDGEEIIAIDGDRLDPDSLITSREVFFYGLVPESATRVEFRDPREKVVASTATFAPSSGSEFRAFAVRNVDYSLEPNAQRLPALALVALDAAGEEVARRQYEARLFMDSLPDASQWVEAWRWPLAGTELLGVRAVALVSPSMSSGSTQFEDPEFMPAICLRLRDQDPLAAQCVRAPTRGRLVDSAIEIYALPGDDVLVIFGVSSERVPSLTATLDDGSSVNGIRLDVPDVQPKDPAFVAVRIPADRWIVSLDAAGQTITLIPETNGTL